MSRELPHNSLHPFTYTDLPQFYLDDLEDELNITALRMLVKDLLILFQACNEGVINVLGTSVPARPGPAPDVISPA